MSVGHSGSSLYREIKRLGDIKAHPETSLDSYSNAAILIIVR